MEKTGLDFEIDPADIDERAIIEKSAYKLVEKLAIAKAREVAKRHPNSIIIGSDLIVSYQDKQIGKPISIDDAKKILQLLRGTTHQVLTGVAVINTEENKVLSRVDTANITMRNYSDKEIDDYIATGEPMDKGGAYAIQGLGEKLVDRIEGDREVIIGFSTRTVLDLIAEVQNQDNRLMRKV